MQAVVRRRWKGLIVLAACGLRVSQAPHDLEGRLRGVRGVWLLLINSDRIPMKKKKKKK